MDRRRFLLTSLAGALAAPLAPTNARAQVSKSVYRIGMLSPGPVPHLTDPLIAALQERGWAVGRNLVVEFRETQGDPPARGSTGRGACGRTRGRDRHRRHHHGDGRAA